MGLFKRVLIPSVLIATSGFFLPSASAADCGTGENYGATPPPNRLAFISERMPETGKALSERARIEATELAEAWESWNDDFTTHKNVCLAQEQAKEEAATLSSEAPSAPVGPAPAAASGSIESIICDVFGDYCSQALSVAMCESTMNPAAVNGQYLGLFQMGESERATYGHGPDAATQARSAYAYFAASGYDWSPWACKP